VATNQIAAFRDWEQPAGERFADLRAMRQPTLVVNGVRDELIPVSTSYRLVENLPNAALHVYPDAGHGSLFQYHPNRRRKAGDDGGSSGRRPRVKHRKIPKDA
jgi:pimeloyl-ACP methyl ester carboxylesterase